MTGSPPQADRSVAAASTALGRSYWLLLTSSGVSNLGDGISSAALPLLAAAITDDPLAFSGVAVAGRLPWLFFALQAGAIADRVDRRRLMVAMQVLRFVLFGVLGIAAVGDMATMLLLYVVALLVGVCETLYDNAAQALMPALVDRDQLEKANGRLFSVEWSLNQFVGPPLGGVLFAVAAGLPILLDAGTFLVSAVLLVAIRGTFGPRTQRPLAAGDDGVGAGDAPIAPDDGGDGRPRDAQADTTPAIADPPTISPAEGRATSMTDEIREGLRWLWGHDVLRTLAVLLGISNGATMIGFATFALYATDPDVLGLGEAGFGLLLTTAGIGSIAGGLLADRIVARIGRTASLWSALLLFPITNVLYAVAPSWVLVAVAAMLFGVTATVWNVITVSLRQAIIPDHLLGRVNSVYRFLGWGSMPIGAFIGGVVADAFGLRAPWAVGAVLMALPLPWAARHLTTTAVTAARADPGSGPADPGDDRQSDPPRGTPGR